jgi:hypothetical protein
MPGGVAQASSWYSCEDMPMTNLTIANILLAISIICMVVCVSAAMPLMFIYSTVATALAGAVRYQQLPHDKAGRRR